ncbi:uncharacterized protein LOC126660559 [Mercurialis annua]|uniref:uncharacterized protein LOC126660559 n=1 Tax=Mercurialis annua TaxID=3986 RepID=UPI00215E71BA|nr:uncharacterized protein LOC126660559 [Mercurialis annua]
MRTKANKLSKFMQITKSPIKFFCKARDFYVKNIFDIADSGKLGHGSLGGGTTKLPKSFSVNSSRKVDDEEFRQLLRLLSKKDSEIELSNAMMRRSYSVGIGKIGRIDEERACSFKEEDEEDGINGSLFSRSRSYANTSKFVY